MTAIIRVDVKKREDAKAIERALADPATRAACLTVGYLLPMKQGALKPTQARRGRDYHPAYPEPVEIPHMGCVGDCDRVRWVTEMIGSPTGDAMKSH